MIIFSLFFKNLTCFPREGYPCATGYPNKQVKVSSGFEANFTCRVTLSPGSMLPALLTCFIMRDILCNGPKFGIILEVLYTERGYIKILLTDTL